jgi:transposase
MKGLRLTWQGGEIKDHDVGRRGAWDECSWTMGGWSRTRGRGGWKAISFHGVPAVLISERKKKNAVLISGSNQVFIVVFLISASNKVLYRRLHDVRDAASTPGLMSFDPASVDVVARNFCPLRRCPASFLGATTMLYPNKREKCN